MDKTFKLMNPVQWHEGLLLYPQHFQQMRREFQQLGLCYLSMGTPHYWGVRYVTVDEAALASGLLRIKTLLAVMPDGSILERSMDSKQVIELNLKDYAEALEEDSMIIHLAVTHHQKDAAMVQGEFPRYDSVEGPPLTDENTGEGAVPIPRLALKGALVAGDTVPVRYASFPLFKMKAVDGGFVFEDFIAPALDIRRGGALGTLCGDLVKALRKHTALLSERLQAPVTQDNASVLDQYKKNYDTMVSRLLGLEALVASEQVHPFRMYQELCTIAGVFCAFSRGHMPPIFDPYDHNDLKATFDPVFRFIEQMLEFVRSASAAFPFHWEGDVFRSNLKADWIQNDSLILGVTLPADASPRLVTEWMKKAVISSISMADKAREKRVLGAPREIVEQVAELGLTMTRGKFLVRVDARSEYIKPGEDLQVFNVSDASGARPAGIVVYTASE